MSRRSNGGANKISLGDITAARFLRLSAWTTMSFIYVEDSTTDDCVIIAKWTGAATQFKFRTDAQTAPTHLEIQTTGNDIRVEGGNNIQLDTWYLAAATNDGTGGAGGLKVYLIGMDGTVLDDGVSGSHPGDDGDLTGDIELFRRGTSDEMSGRVAYASYFQKELTRQDILEYLHRPGMVVAKYKGDGVPFFLPLGLSSPEVDWSGSGNLGTVSGTLTITDNPPSVGPLFGFDLGWQGAFTAAAAAAGWGPLLSQGRNRLVRAA